MSTPGRTPVETDGPGRRLSRGVTRRRPNRRVALLGLLLLAAAAALWFFTIGPGATTTVPKVIGSTTQAAERALTLSHLTPKVVRSFNETIKAGVVITAKPPAGGEVGRGSTVILTVSQGAERYAVPRLVGHSQAEAEKRLTEARLTVGAVSQAFSETVAPGQVVSTSPAADASVKRLTAVALVISKGRQPIVLQDWTGKPANQAVKALSDAKLKVDATRQDFNDTVPKGSVILQTPATGTLFQGDLVTLIVSKGPELVLVPSVIGKPEAQARLILQHLGFTVFIDQPFGGSNGTVLAQSVLPGRKVPKGTPITPARITLIVV